MRFCFITPPFFGVSMPQLGVPSICAALKLYAPDVETRQFDLNAAFIQEIFSQNAIDDATVIIRDELDRLETRKTLSGLLLLRYHQLAESWLSISPTINSIKAAIEILRSPNGISSEQMKYASKSIRDVLSIISTAWWPSRLMMHGHDLLGEETNLDSLLTFSGDENRNMFLTFAIQHIRKLLAWKPDLIGISLSTRGQLLPAVTICRALADLALQIPVIVGGALASLHQEHCATLLRKVPGLKAIAFGEGERIVLDLVSHLHKYGDFNSVAGLAIRAGGSIIINEPSIPLSPAEIPTPVFDSESVKTYLTPVPVLPLLTSRGCPWRRCAFCSHHMIYKHRYSKRPIDELVKDLKALSDCHSTNRFYFVDESISAQRLYKLSLAILDSGLNIRWGAESRIENTFTCKKLRICSKAGCSILSWGMESSVQRVLDMMDKGIDVNHFVPVLKAVKDAGIRNHCMVIIGFPGETRKEAEKTIDFLKKQRKLVDLVGCSPFTLGKTCPVAALPERYGVTLLNCIRNNHLLEENLAYNVSEGLSGLEAYDLYHQLSFDSDGSSEARIQILGRLAWLFDIRDRANRPNVSNDKNHPRKFQRTTKYMISRNLSIGVFHFPLREIADLSNRLWHAARRDALKNRTTLYTELMHSGQSVEVQIDDRPSVYVQNDGGNTFRIARPFAYILRQMIEPTSLEELEKSLPIEYIERRFFEKLLQDEMIMPAGSESIQLIK